MLPPLLLRYLYGDGVIIAVRLQAMAEPGGICLAGSVHDQVGNKLPLAFEDLGACEVKNIAKPVRALRVRMEERESDRTTPQQPAPFKPSIVVGVSGQFEVSGLERRHWTNATPIRRIFAEAFARADLPYFNPHSFRKTLAQVGEQVCRTPEEFKAWSQNLGHEKVLTTFSSYGDVATKRQAEIIRKLALSKAPSAEFNDLVQRFLHAAQQSDIP